MFLETKEFVETDDSFRFRSLGNAKEWMRQKQFCVKAHEKNIYRLPENLILAEIHRDNDGEYPFSKVDFLSHRLLKLVFPKNVPQVLLADFSNQNCPFFILERIPLDVGHICYNMSRHKVHRASGRDFQFSSDFFKVPDGVDLEGEARKHAEKVKQLQESNQENIREYGITFDHSAVNITFLDDGNFVSLEVHKGTREYLFNQERFIEYVNRTENTDIAEEALLVVKRLQELQQERKGKLSISS